MSTPSLTVLMSVYNGARYLDAAIASILAQTHRDFEFLIIDDASTDASRSLIEAYRDPRIRLVRNPVNLGLTRSLNLGLGLASGEFIARQDADDLSAPKRLATQLAFFRNHPDAALLGSQAWLLDQHGGSRGLRDLPLEPASIRWANLFENPIPHSAVMFRTRIIRDEMGGYDETFGCCQDYELWSRLMTRFPVHNLPERLVGLREHSASVSVTRAEEAGRLVRRVVDANLLAAFPDRSFSDEDRHLLNQYRAHLAPADLLPFHRLYSALQSAFLFRFSSGVATADFQRTTALHFARTAYNLLTRDRALAAREFLRAIRAWPSIALHQPWVRIAALAVLGENARRLHERRERRK
ncbi:MAG: glycosyltransferase [Verrucomicrobiota bacterium]